MKKILYTFAILLGLSGCTENDYHLFVSVNKLEFRPTGGEQVVEISSIASWDCEYSADWLLIRQLQDGIRVVVDENTSSLHRSDVIKIKVNGTVKNEIIVNQSGIDLSTEDRQLSVVSSGDVLSVPILCNTQWTFENNADWCSIDKIDDNLSITVDRNYSMNGRDGIIKVKAGGVSFDITISQSGCRWFESFEMVEVPGGTFYMGAQKEYSSEPNYDASAYQIESPVHQVSISSFSIGVFEVTQAQWMAAMGDNPSAIQGDNLPVENVTWEQVQEFISILNEQSGLDYRLPTEAEWEFAAKGGNLSNGFNYSGNSVLSACGWYYSNSEATTHEVGSKIPNELGIYDMSGNVREWCSDWFEYYSSEMAENPQGPYEGNLKVNRGGSWTTPAVNCRNTYRHTNYVYESFHDLGFRLVLSSQ